MTSDPLSDLSLRPELIVDTGSVTFTICPNSKVTNFTSLFVIIQEFEGRAVRPGREFDIDSDSEADLRLDVSQTCLLTRTWTTPAVAAQKPTPSRTQVDIHYLFIVTYSLVFMAYSLVFCT